MRRTDVRARMPPGRPLVDQRAGASSGGALLRALISPGPRRPTGGSGPRSVRTAASRSAARVEMGRTKRPRPSRVTVRGTRADSAPGRAQAQRPEGDVRPHLGHRAPAAAGGAEDDARPEGHGEGRAPDRGAVARGAAGAGRRPDDPDVGAALAQDALGHPQPGVAPTRRSARGAGRGRSGRCSSSAPPRALPAQGGALPGQPVGAAGETRPPKAWARSARRRASPAWPRRRAAPSPRRPPSGCRRPGARVVLDAAAVVRRRRAAGAGRGAAARSRPRPSGPSTTQSPARRPRHGSAAGRGASGRPARRASGVRAGSGVQIGPAEEGRRAPST